MSAPMDCTTGSQVDKELATKQCETFLSKHSPHWCFTKSDLVTCPFVWAIDNFSFYLAKNDFAQHKSGYFTDTTSLRHQWFLTMECRKKQDKDQRQVLITIKMNSCAVEKVKTKIKFFFLDTRGCSLIDKESEEVCIFTGTDQGWSWNIPHEYLVEIVKNCAYSKDTFVIKCELDILVEIATMTSLKRKRSFELSSTSFIEDFGEMYRSGKYSDMTICVGEHQFAVHKVILASRSPVFAAMFEHQMKETVESRIVIEDIKALVFEELLLFVYTGNRPNVDRFALDLLIAADKYGLDNLKVLCEESIAYNLLSIESAANILVLADMHNAAQLKEYTMDYIAKNALKILSTEGWNILVQNHTQLIVQAFAKLAEKITPDQAAKPHRKSILDSKD